MAVNELFTLDVAKNNWIVAKSWSYPSIFRDDVQTLTTVTKLVIKIFMYFDIKTK